MLKSEGEPQGSPNIESIKEMGLHGGGGGAGGR